MCFFFALLCVPLPVRVFFVAVARAVRRLMRESFYARVSRNNVVEGSRRGVLDFRSSRFFRPATPE